jgi:hypothetical protein
MGRDPSRLMQSILSNIGGIREKNIGLYAIGEIAYRDDLRLRRTTRFCRLYDWKKERFLPVSDRDNESDDY